MMRSLLPMLCGALVVGCGGNDDPPADGTSSSTPSSSSTPGDEGTTLPAPDDDADFDGVADADDCAPDDPEVYPGAYDAPGDGVDADCDGDDPAHGWVGEWEVVNVQALYSTYPILVPDTAEGTLVIDDDGDTELEATSQLDPDLVGSSVPFDVFADLEHEGHAAPMARSDEVMLYLEGEVSAPGLEEVSYADILCVLVDDEMWCEGTLKALGGTLDTEVTLRRAD